MNYVSGHWRTNSLVQKNKSLDDFKQIAVTDGKENSFQLVAPQKINPVFPYATYGSADTKSLTANYSKTKTASIEETVTQHKKIDTMSKTNN